MERNSFYITTPIYYPNAQPHLGHAYSTLVCDFATRYHRSKGDEVYFLTGTDENTEKVIEAAEKVGEDPHTYLEKVVATFKELYASLDIDYTQFIRTSDERAHWPGAIEMWKLLEQNGDLYKGEYHGLYCVGCEAFITEKELINGKCPTHGTEPKRLSEENYFFRLSSYTDRLREVITKDELPIIPSTRKQEILALLDQGLEDISFSRPAKAITWGIPVPGDSSQKMYVWMDALTNYISALGFGRGEENMHFWPGVHVVGKDILRFHAAIWPAMLLSAGLPLPRTILVHGMIISDGKKMSKSLGNVIDPNEMVSRYGSDATRYLLLRHVNPFEDSDITRGKLDEWYTAHLTNGLGNLVARVMKLAEEHLPHPVELSDADEALDPAYSAAIDAFRFNEALDLVFRRITEADEFMTARAPYKGVKSGDAVERERARDEIAQLVRELARIATHLTPAMPRTAAAILSAVRKNEKPENLFPRV